MAQKPCRILVADDDPTLCKTMGKLLERDGYAVECASTPADALTAFRAQPCDLVLMDLLMPGMTGQELAPHIKRHNPNVPIVLISAFPPDHIGSVDYIFPKPITPRRLREIVQSILGDVNGQADVA